MESPNAEFRQTFAPKLDMDQQIGLRDLLKVYGLGILPISSSGTLGTQDEDNNNPTMGKEHNILETSPKSPTETAIPSSSHPAELLRSAFTEQLFNTQLLEMYRNANALRNPQALETSEATPPSTPPNANTNPTTTYFGSSNSWNESWGAPKTDETTPEQTLLRFETAIECGQIECILQQLREHYHCEDRFCVRDCDQQPQPTRRYLRTFSKKEEIIRHCKWHKKRAETLKFGFLRFSCLDDCQDSNNGMSSHSPNQSAPSTTCQFNGKQTHYHCIEPDCDKVYISTSDVQMHANYHRKTNAIRMQGFLRVRNLELCQEPGCPYATQQTTHFHCLRDNCRFTFKNKGEMEKHKVFHLKDDQLLSDGFKKFFKTDTCKFADCRYDGKLNHIHCIRPSCSSVFHSSGQLMSHKRKHEKTDQLLREGNQSTGNGGSFPMGGHSLSDCDASSASADNSLLDLSVAAGSAAITILPPPPVTVKSEVVTIESSRHTGAQDLSSQSTPNGDFSAGSVVNSVNQKITQVTSIDGLFNRKRGRPPKNRFVEVYNSSHARTSYTSHPQSTSCSGNSLSMSESPQAIFASFKLDKSVTGATVNGSAAVAAGNARKKAKLGESVSRPDTIIPDASYVTFASQVPQQNHIRYEQKNAVEDVEMETASLSVERKPGSGLIKSKGIFFPNVVRQTESTPNKECGRRPVTGNQSRQTDTETSSEAEDSNNFSQKDEEDEDEDSRNDNAFSQGLSSIPTAFVPTMFPINLEAMEQNNRAAQQTNSLLMPPGLEWLKYAYQQSNPLMVFATTAALLAASINPGQTSGIEQQQPQAAALMDPNVLEYAKNMFLYNNMQSDITRQQAQPPNLLLGHATTTTGLADSFNSSLSGAASMYSNTSVSKPSGNGFAKDEVVPAGYLKFRFNEDCHFATCGYRNHQSHFHCLRDNCFYSFCDKTRFVQHTARHERLDKLMGSDFKQFRSNMNCGYEGCEFSSSHSRVHSGEDEDTNASTTAAATGTGASGGKLKNASKSSHFHCQKCDYVCTDTNKVVAHRRQHTKTDYIRLSGFRKVPSAESCRLTPQDGSEAVAETEAADQKCHYSGKQTHYHCLVCNGVVLNRSQLAVHRHKGQPK